VDHFVLAFHGLFHQYLVEAFFGRGGTDFGRGFFFGLFINRNSSEFLTKIKMILDVIVISNFLKNETEQILESIFLIRGHITANTLIGLIEHPLKAGIDFSRLVHGKGDRVHF
jgi:hypothetical protein